MLNNQILKVLYIILKGICSAWKGFEILFINKYFQS